MPATARSLATLQSIRKRWGAPQAPAYIEALHPAQRAFVEDPSKRKAALCSRRAGKTEGVAAWLLQGAEDSPGEMSVYIALTRNNARMILWATLQAIERRHELGLKFGERDGQLLVTAPNRHRLWLVGCKDASEVDKFRGMKYRRAAVDEAASYGAHLSTLVEDALEPALMDLDGEMALVGTPGLTPAGLFYSATTGDGAPQWSTHSWTVLDNPYIPHASRWLEKKRAANGWDVAHPTYRREWLGQWVRDEEAQVYPYDPGRNRCLAADRPPGSCFRSMAVDLGFNDASAFVIASTQQGSGTIYVERAWKRPGLTVAAIAAQIEQARRQHNVQRVVVDEGALGKTIAHDLRTTYGVPCEPAEKKAKLAAIHHVRSMLLAGSLQVDSIECQPLISEWQLLPWDEERRDHDARFLDDCSDALLYAVRALPARYDPREAAPRPGTREWHEAEKRRMREETRRKVLVRQKSHKFR